MTEAMKPYMDQLQSRSLIIGIAGLAVTGVGFVVNSQMVLQSYLLAFMLWGGVAIGCLGLLMLHHMVGGGWGVAMATAGSERGLTLRSPGRFLATAERLAGLYARRDESDDVLRRRVADAWMKAEAYQLQTLQTVTR